MPVIAPAPRPVRTKSVKTLLAALAACLALYGIDLACMASVPASAQAYTASVAVPFDLMVCVPLAFYLLVVRPRRLSPVFVLPVIYLGAAVSAYVVPSVEASLLAVLLPATLVVDAAILGHEGLRLVRAFQAARSTSDRPLDWFEKPLLELARNERVAHLTALECTIWYYLLGSWRTSPFVPVGSRAFSCHRQNGFLALSGVIMALLPIETAVIHVLVAQWSPVAACVLTAISLYTLAWFAGNTRAVVLNPLLVDNETLTVRWGAFFEEVIPLDAIARIDTNKPDIPKGQLMDMGTMGSQPFWIVLDKPQPMRGLTGKVRLVRAVNVSPDDSAGFRRLLLEQRL